MKGIRKFLGWAALSACSLAFLAASRPSTGVSDPVETLRHLDEAILSSDRQGITGCFVKDSEGATSLVDAYATNLITRRALVRLLERKFHAKQSQLPPYLSTTTDHAYKDELAEFGKSHAVIDGSRATVRLSKREVFRLQLTGGGWKLSAAQLFSLSDPASDAPLFTAAAGELRYAAATDIVIAEVESGKLATLSAASGRFWNLFGEVTDSLAPSPPATLSAKGKPSTEPGE